jgi:hypothetical protein
MFSGMLEGVENLAHTCMIKVGELASSGGFICLILEACGGEIAEQNIGTTGGLATNLLWDIPNC